MPLHKLPTWIVGLVQAALVFGYILLFAFVAMNIQDWVAYRPSPVIVMPIMLTLFVFSALFCGGSVLGYPLTPRFRERLTDG